MPVMVRIPAPLRRLTQGQSTLEVNGKSVAECLEHLEARFPGIKLRLLDETGEFHHFVNIYVNGEDVRFLQGINTPTREGDEVSIVPAVAGG